RVFDGERGRRDAYVAADGVAELELREHGRGRVIGPRLDGAAGAEGEVQFFAHLVVEAEDFFGVLPVAAVDPPGGLVEEQDVRLGEGDADGVVEAGGFGPFGCRDWRKRWR